jgi:putative PIN family toxin of toxin-antitoxin system
MDADCLIAGTLAPSGACSRLLDHWQSGEFELIVCPNLIEEVRRALLHPRIADKYGISSTEVDSLTQRLREESLLFDDPIDPPRVVPDDPNDDYLIALALASPTNWFVTRDRHFDNVQIEGLTIVPPRRALQVVEGRA